LILNADSEDTKSSFGMNDTLLDSHRNNTLLEQHSLREILLAIECFQSRIINLKSYLREAYNKTDYTQKSQKKKDLNGFHKMKNVGRPFGEDGDEITAEMLFGVNNPLINPHIERICKEVNSYFVVFYFFPLDHVILSDNIDILLSITVLGFFYVCLQFFQVDY